MFIQTEATPNPATLKFLPGQPVMEEGTFEARDLDQAERSPLAKALMQLPGVGGVFFASDFISVTKTEGEWQHLKPAVLGVVTEFYLSGAPLIEHGGADAVGAGVQGVLEQLLDHGSRTVDHFAGSDLVGDLVSKDANAAHEALG